MPVGWKVSIQQNNPLEIQAETLVNPASGTSLDEGSQLPKLIEFLTPEIREKLADNSPVRIGKTVVSRGGELPVSRIIHTPIQSSIDSPTTLENLQVSLRSALVRADEESLTTAVLPKFFPNRETDNLDPEEVARTLVEDLAYYPPNNLKELVIVSRDEQWLDWCRDYFPK